MCVWVHISCDYLWMKQIRFNLSNKLNWCSIGYLVQISHLWLESDFCRLGVLKSLLSCNRTPCRQKSDSSHTWDIWTRYPIEHNPPIHNMHLRMCSGEIKVTGITWRLWTSWRVNTVDVKSSITFRTSQQVRLHPHQHYSLIYAFQFRDPINTYLPYVTFGAGSLQPALTEAICSVDQSVSLI